MAIFPEGGGGGGTAVYGLYKYAPLYGFQAVYSGIGYINQKFGSRIEYHFPFKLINWLRILV